MTLSNTETNKHDVVSQSDNYAADSHEAFLIARDVYSIACTAFREAEDLYRSPRDFHSDRATSSVNFDLACDSYEDARIAYKKAYNAYMSPYLNNKEI